MSPTYPRRGSSWQRWQQTLVICGVVVLSNGLTALAVRSRVPTAAEIGASLPDRGTAGRGRGSRAEAPAPEVGEPGQDSKSSATVKAFSRGSVEKLDRILSQRLEAIAREKGVEVQTLLPRQELRDAALGSQDLASKEAQALIAEYTRVFRELGQEMPTPPAP